VGYINEVNLCTMGRIHLQVGGKCVDERQSQSANAQSTPGTSSGVIDQLIAVFFFCF